MVRPPALHPGAPLPSWRGASLHIPELTLLFFKCANITPCVVSWGEKDQKKEFLRRGQKGPQGITHWGGGPRLHRGKNQRATNLFPPNLSRKKIPTNRKRGNTAETTRWQEVKKGRWLPSLRVTGPGTQPSLEEVSVSPALTMCPPWSRVSDPHRPVGPFTYRLM